ncbi:MAG: polyprenyl synthetase family protein [Dehalococcoidia bacterium]|nr:polyprenyl synthetase family protein [Dehalococcoidia bacterium]
MPAHINSTVAILQAEIRKIIGSYCEDSTFRGAVMRALADPGFALHSDAHCRAGILTLEVFRVVSGSPSAVAVKAAVAVELHMQAAYLFDSVADRDKASSSGLGAAEELAIAIGLMSYGQSAVCEAASAAGRRGYELQSLLRWTADCASQCCTGQFLDAYLEKRPEATVEEALKMTSLKAGSLGRFAAGLGASIATEDYELVRLSSEFGFNLFTYLQLLDDLRDALEVQDLPGDLMRHKKTLPTVFLRNSLTEGNSMVACSIIPSEPCTGTKAIACQGFEPSWPRFFGAIVAEAFLNRAKGNLADIKKRLGTVGNLEHFVRSFEITPQEVVVNL